MKRILLIMLISILGVSFQAMAQGDLLITPNRVVFEGNKQKEELNLLNMGKDTTTYSISFVQKNMKEDGSFVNIEKPDSGQLFADPFLRIFPRKVTLAPREPQVIMLQFRRKADMVAGEYRSHLYFRSEKNYNPLGIKSSGNDTALLSVQLIPIFGMTIPIIIRTGKVNVSASLSDLKLITRHDTIKTLKISINRSGNISTYGNIKIDYFPIHGKPYQVGTVTGVAVYTNLNKRNIVVNLKVPSGNNLTEGKLKVSYITNDETKKPVIYAETELILGK
jgi:hypothetical protein